MDRKQFLSHSLKASLGALVAAPALANLGACDAGDAAVEGTDSTSTTPVAPLQLAQITLPYAFSAMEPVIDTATMEIHYGKHHAAYVKNANEAIAAEGVQAGSDIDLLAGIGAYSTKLRNNAGGTWNHNFFWQVMAPTGSSTPPSTVLDAINGTFGDIEKFKAAFTDAAMKRFGSGWAWLVVQNGTLAIGSTPNQDSPLMDVSEFKGTPLLALDVWEHAYYLKYQNKRNEYVANWWQVVNWEEVAKRL
ncbi:MAG: superoxide dismutase [Flavobacteriales bacterium]